MANHGRLPIRTEADVDQLLADFEKYLRSQKLADLTVRTQMGGAKRFADYLSGKPRSPKKKAG